MKKETKREALYRNDAAIDRIIRDAKDHIHKIEEIRNVAERIIGSNPNTIIGETEIYDASKSEQFPKAAPEWVFDSQGKLGLYLEWLRLKKEVIKVYRYDTDKQGNVILAKRWLDEVNEQHTVYVYDEEIAIIRELRKATEAISSALTKTGINVTQMIDKDITGGSYSLNLFKAHQYLQLRKRELAKTT